jgi:capsular exopolysaccharide synthesis family protein
MSNIFDALQRAESEIAGSNSPTFSLVTELLQAAEQKVRESALNVEQLSPEQRHPVHSIDLSGPTAPPAEYPGREDVERCPQLPVSLPEESRLVSVCEEGSLGAEKFRFLAVRLRQLRQNRPLKKVLITSTIPQEGKSTVANNLACTLARKKQQKTLLLEGDLRRPSLAAQFGFGKLPGLCEWLSGQTETINIYRLEGLGLWILPAGSAPENPLELMQSGKLATLMQQLEGWFDWIVIDSPPVLPLADASLWSRVADGVLLVTRKGTTEKQQLQRGLEVIEKSKLLGALVNGSENVAHSDYYQRYTASSAQQSRE